MDRLISFPTVAQGIRNAQAQILAKEEDERRAAE